MAEDQGEIQSGVEKQISFVEKGPRFVDGLTNLQERQNGIKSTDEKGRARSFSEEEGLKDLQDFVDLTISTATEKGDQEVEETARLFKENLVYIGENELKRATSGIAEHLLQESREGKNVFLYWCMPRSERYVTLRVLEELDRLTEEAPELRDKFKVSQSPQEIAKVCLNSPDNSLVVVPDDFVVSGTRIQGFVSNVFEGLLAAGFSPDKASSIIEADVVATKTRSENSRLTVGDKETERDFQVFSFYEINEYRNSKGELATYPGSSFTGSHSSTDYGFETVLRNFSEYLDGKKVEYKKPLLTDIVRPYATSPDGKYEDPILQGRWERVQQRYGLVV